ncbi:MAG: hypothetical protein IT354_00900 [Gemmatimonadaceae bacterium]|jgi:hypothetical protein|nr:hypothetical protein [Gemmatimonadaceae bacterium]
MIPLRYVLLAAATQLMPASSADAPVQSMSFFITSVGVGDGANLGGVAGADRHCASLAEAAGVRGKTWHAYLGQQASNGKPAIHARDRIGKGPWMNAKGVVVATSVDDLHSDSNKLSKENSLTEKGMPVNGRGDTPNTHDILTGVGLDGRVSSDTTDTTCRNWTSNTTGAASVGHHDRQGGGANPTSWNNAHPSRGCSQDNLKASGGAALFYCFAS